MKNYEIKELERFIDYLDKEVDLDKYSTSDIASCYVLGYGLLDVVKYEMNYKILPDLSDATYDECQNVENEIKKILNSKEV